MERALRKANVPYRLLGGRSFFDRKEILDLLGYLRVAANRDDEEALLRIINTPPRGVGAKALESLRREAARRGSSLWAVIDGLSDDLPDQLGFRPAQVTNFRNFAASVQQLSARAARRSTSLIEDLIKDIDYSAEIERSYKDGNRSIHQAQSGA